EVEQVDRCIQLSASCFANLMFLAEMSPDTIVVGRKHVAT
ncbi:hypothetical protein FoTM2_017684, partial [Fusarium oxysporum f. sp. vasinfectum]